MVRFAPGDHQLGEIAHRVTSNGGPYQKRFVLKEKGEKRSCDLVFTRIYKYVFFSLLPPFPYTPPNPSHPFLYILIAFILSFSFLQSFPLTPTLSPFLPFRTLFPLTSSLFLPFPFMTPFFSLLKEDNTLEPGHSFV